MSKMKNDIKYSQSDIENYHSGKMNAQDMHLLEKAALEDPFLADALEGYQFTSTARQDLNKIDERLNNITDEKKVITLVPRKYTWLKYAALILVMAGGGWVIFQSVSNKNESIAITNTKDSIKNDAISKPSESDSNSIVLKAPNRIPEVSKPNESNNSNTTSRPGKINSKSEVTTMSNQSSASKLPESKKEKVAVNQGITKDIAKANDDDLKKQKDTQRLDVVLLPSNEAMNEVVVTSHLKAKQRNLAAPLQSHTAEPSGGWKNFYEYVKKNIGKETPDIKFPSGTVELSFDINENGTPVNIKVLKSLCPSCDKEAVRLLTSGPKWNYTTAPAGKVTITL